MTDRADYKKSVCPLTAPPPPLFERCNTTKLLYITFLGESTFSMGVRNISL